jgi:hypothetical protein
MDQSSSPDSNPVIVGKPRRRWVKVDVDEEVFVSLHQKAAESRMRIMPYLRMFLAEARAIALERSESLSFSTGAQALPDRSTQRSG